MSSAVVQFSGGVGSYFALRRAGELYGWENTVAAFADVLIEDEDLYRFVDDVETELLERGSRLVRLTEGRDPWEVFFDVRFLGNSRIDPCSRILKRETLRSWLEETYPEPGDADVVLGFDWTEAHRFERAIPRHAPYRAVAPLCDPPYRAKWQLLDELRDLGHVPPRLYLLGGFSHNNCGGFCVKGGHASFRRLLQVFPERYAYHERREQELRAFLDADVAILRYRSGPKKDEPLTLEHFRLGIEAIEAGLPRLFDPDAVFEYDPTDTGSCDCAAGNELDELPLETAIELTRRTA